jgi:hypothetical protein
MIQHRIRSILSLAGVLTVVLLLAAGRGPGRVQAQGTLHTLTQSDSMSQLSIPVGDSVELRLPTTYDWNVSITNLGVLTRPPIALAQGVQGFWNASAPGESVITATGTVHCAPGQACPQLAVLFTATVDVTAPGQTAPTTQIAQTAAYGAGWNLIAAPAGTDLSGATGPLYTLQPGDSGYQTVQQSTGTLTGLGYWADFSATATVGLAAGSNAPYSVDAPAGQFVMIGDPSGTEPATVSGADDVWTYTPPTGYVQSARLTPGQGAFAVSLGGGTITVTPQAEAPTMPPATAHCGSVNSLGGHVTSSNAQQAEDCFFQAYQTCNSAATFTATINGVDAGTTHMFSLSGSSGTCTITDVAQTRVIPRPAGPQMTYTCSSLSQTPQGLVFASCGDLGDVTVPAP